MKGESWESNKGGGINRRVPKEDLAFEVLIDEIARGNGTIPPASQRIPPDMLCITTKAWRQVYMSRTIAESDEAAEQQFYRASRKLINTLKTVGKFGNWVWPVR